MRQIAPSGGEQKTDSSGQPRTVRRVGGGLTRKERVHTAQTDTAHEPHIHNSPVAKTRGAEIHSHLCRADQAPPTGLVRQKSHHQVLQQSLRILELDIGPVRGVGGLLEEHSVAGDLANVDWDAKTLGCKDTVHERNILCREVAADREDQDARLEGWRACVLDTVVSTRICGTYGSWCGGCGGEEGGLLVYVG